MAEGKRYISLLPKQEYCRESAINPGTFGIHDTLRDGITSVRGKSLVTHPLEHSEKNFHKNKQSQEFSVLRSTQGLHMPMKLQTERAILAKVQRLPGFESSRLSLRTVLGDEELGFDDLLCGPGQPYNLIGERERFERQQGMF